MILRYWHPENDPIDSYKADYETLIRSARRCAYDLDHVVGALDMVDPEHFYIKEMKFADRARNWVELFAKGNPGKDYRMNMHREVDRLADELEAAEKATKQARCEALEEAAAICDDLDRYPAMEPEHCAAYIRALITKEQA